MSLRFLPESPFSFAEEQEIWEASVHSLKTVWLALSLCPEPGDDPADST